MNLFGYIYYRIAKHILNMGRSIRADALTTVSGVQALLISFWLIAPLIKAHSSDRLFVNELISSILLFGVLTLVNFWVHVKKYNDYDRRWGNEDFWTRTIKGILVIVFLMSPLLLFWWLQYQTWF